MSNHPVICQTIIEMENVLYFVRAERAFIPFFTALCIFQLCDTIRKLFTLYSIERLKIAID